jgi:hypothetical protein
LPQKKNDALDEVKEGLWELLVQLTAFSATKLPENTIDLEIHEEGEVINEFFTKEELKALSAWKKNCDVTAHACKVSAKIEQLSAYYFGTWMLGLGVVSTLYFMGTYVIRPLFVGK